MKLTAIVLAALTFGAAPAHADQTDDAFTKDLQGRGITLPANVKPGSLGATVCVFMAQGHSMGETSTALVDGGYKGMTFTGKQAIAVVLSAYSDYCPDQPPGGGPS
jgi:Protein of unknown function (DUF732)